MNLHLREKIVVITGSGSGIGESIASQLSPEGAYVALIDKNEKNNELALEKIQASGGFGISITADLTDPNACLKAIDTVVQRFGRIDALVNNAGINDKVGLLNGSYEDFMDSYKTNAAHYFLMAKSCLPHLIKQKGVILNISSKVAETGQGGTSGYAAANGARNALTREWAVDLLPYGIRVNAIIVAEVLTPMYSSWLHTQAPDTLTKITAKIPLGKRMTVVEEIANTACFLLSSRSSHTTGQLIHIDGGYVHLDRRL